MNEQNQKLASVQTWNSLFNKLQDFNNWKESENQKKTAQLNNTMDNDNKMLYQTWLNATDATVKQQCDKACRTNQVAQMVSTYAQSQWKDVSGYEPLDLLNAYLNNNPDKFDAVKNFVNSDQNNIEFAVQMGWANYPTEEEVAQQNVPASQVDETFWDKAKTWAVWPLARAFWAVIGWVKWVGKWVMNIWNRADEFNQWQTDEWYIDEEWNNQDKGLYDAVKWFWKLAWSFWDVVWDVVWWWIMWAAEWFTTNQEQAAVKNKVWQVIQWLVQSKPADEVKKMYDNLSEDQKTELMDWIKIIDWVSNLPLSALWVKWVKEAVKQWAKWLETNAIKQWVKTIDDVTWEVWDLYKWIERNIAIKNLDKNRAAAEEQVRDITQLASGTKDIKDINRLKKEWRSALSQVDTKWVKTYKDLGWRIGNKQTEIAKQVDEVLSKDNTKYSWVWTKEVDLPDWKKTPNVIKPIETGLNDLEKLYTKIWDDEWIAIVNFWKNKLATEWLTKKEMNDISRMYGNEFSSKAFKEDWTLKFSDVWEWFENNRDNMKEYVRSLMPDDTTKQLDRTYHELADTKFLVNRMASKVESIQQKIRDKSLFQKIWWGLWDLIDIVSWGSIKALLGKLIKWWTESMDAADLEKQLPKMLSKLDDLNRKIDLANTDEEVQEVAKIINSFK